MKPAFSPGASSLCRFLSDTAEVRTFWDLGYRDPFSLRADGVPTTWTELNSRTHWRNQVHIVRFRLWTAVLISMDRSSHQVR